MKLYPRSAEILTAFLAAVLLLIRFRLKNFLDISLAISLAKELDGAQQLCLYAPRNPHCLSVQETLVEDLTRSIAAMSGNFFSFLEVPSGALIQVTTKTAIPDKCYLVTALCVDLASLIPSTSDVLLIATEFSASDAIWLSVCVYGISRFPWAQVIVWLFVVAMALCYSTWQDLTAERTNLFLFAVKQWPYFLGLSTFLLLVVTRQWKKSASHDTAIVRIFRNNVGSLRRLSPWAACEIATRLVAEGGLSPEELNILNIVLYEDLRISGIWNYRPFN